MVVTGEGLVKGCLKYRKGFDMADIGIDVKLRRDKFNTLGFGDHVIAVYSTLARLPLTVLLLERLPTWASEIFLFFGHSDLK